MVQPRGLSRESALRPGRRFLRTFGLLGYPAVAHTNGVVHPGADARVVGYHDEGLPVLAVQPQ